MNIKAFIKKSKPGIKRILFIALIGALGAQEKNLAEIFFLDLGIVIEPAKGSETYSRRVEKPSKEVTFKIKKVESGSVYMASSQELISTLGRINNRIKKLENSFHTEMGLLRDQNIQLRQALVNSEPQEKLVKKELHLERTFESIPLKQAPKEIKAFNRSLYMSGVFAYQREEYKAAIEKFLSLQLDTAPKKTAENILYWLADSYHQDKQYKKALELLNQITTTGTLRIDDALVQKGILYKKMGNEEEALLAFSNVVLQHPDSEYLRLAQMELKKSNNKK